MAIRPLIAALILLAPFATTGQELTFSVTGLPEVTGSTGYIGIADCQDLADNTISFSGSVVTNAETFDMRIAYTVDKQEPCTRLSECNASPPTDSADICGCLSNTSADSISHSRSIVDFWEEVCETPVGTDRSLRFFLRYYSGGGEDDEDETLETAEDVYTVVIDFTPPEAPDSPPTVSAGDGALTVSFEEADDLTYEACAVPTGGGEPKCSGAIGGTARIEGLVNDTRYSVYYVVIDAAGNSSAASPSVESAPIEIRDFAEEYARWNSGERGGCATAPTDDGELPLFFALGLFVLGFVRPRRHR